MLGYAILRVFPYTYPLPHPHSYDLCVVQSLESFISARTMTSEESNKPLPHYVCALPTRKSTFPWVHLDRTAKRAARNSLTILSKCLWPNLLAATKGSSEFKCIEKYVSVSITTCGRSSKSPVNCAILCAQKNKVQEYAGPQIPRYKQPVLLHVPWRSALYECQGLNLNRVSAIHTTNRSLELLYFTVMAA